MHKGVLGTIFDPLSPSPSSAAGGGDCLVLGARGLSGNCKIVSNILKCSGRATRAKYRTGGGRPVRSTRGPAGKF